MTFVMSFFIFGPFVLGWLMFLVEALSGRFEPRLLFGGFAWFILAAFAPFATPLLIFAAPVAGLVLWATLRYLLTHVSLLRSNRWCLVGTSAVLSALISAVVAAVAAQMVFGSTGSEFPSALGAIKSVPFLVAIVGPIGAILGAVLALFVKLPNHFPSVFNSNRAR
jgi:hypothetical protein